MGTEDISKTDCISLAEKIRLDVYRPVNSTKTTIFLCGADMSNQEQMRYRIAERLKNWRFGYIYDIIYPEDIFDELLYSSKTKDLLSLEALLAESVDAIVLIPESPGSFAELGAFANDELLRKKMICIVDKKYKKDRSFINQGPLKLVKKENKFGIVYVDPKIIESELDQLFSLLRKMKKGSLKKNDKISLLQLDNFLLPSIYLLEPVTKETLVKLVGVATESEEFAFQTTTTTLTILTKKRLIELTNNGYKLTTLGLGNFLTLRKMRSRIKTQEETIKLDNFRLEILNLKYRKKRLKV